MKSGSAKFGEDEGGLEGEVTDFATQNLVNSGFAALDSPSERGSPSPSKVLLRTLQGHNPQKTPRSRPARPTPQSGATAALCKKESLPPETKNLAEPDFIPACRKPHRETQRNAYPDMHCE